MKKYFAFIVLFLMISCSGTIEQPEKMNEITVIPVSSVSLSQQSAELVEGESITLTASVSPSNATDNKVSWSSSKSSVASVDQKGTVTAGAIGSATITASAGGKKSSCTVTVVAKTIKVESITLSKTELSLFEGETASLSATVYPSNATDPSITWASSNNSVATIDKNGLITAIKEGTSVISASNGGVKATCSVSVSTGKLSVHISKKGGLQEELSKYEITSVRWLIISGVLNDIDFLYIRENTSHLNKLDISDIDIEEIPILFNYYHQDKPIDIILPKTLNTIKDEQFSRSGVQSVWIGNRVSEIGDLAFGYCERLESIEFEQGNDSNLLDIKGGRIEDIYRYHGAFYSCTSLSSISFPSRIHTIEAGAFDGCKALKKVNFEPNSHLVRIGGRYSSYSSYDSYYSNGAFRGCGIEEISIPSSVKYIDDCAFTYCSSLSKVELKDATNLLSIGAAAFLGTSITSIEIPNSVSSIGEEAFAHTKLSNVVFSKNSSVERIEYRVFANISSLKSIILPASVKTIRYAAFQGNEMEFIKFEPNSQLETLGGGMRGYGWLGIMGGGNFGTGHVGELDLSNCKSIRRFNSYALWFCSAKIMRLGTSNPPEIGEDAMAGCHLTILKVPKEAVDAYKKSDWVKHAESISALDD